MRPINIFWFRRDLRLDDNAGLYHALRDRNPVLPIFVFDKNILDDLADKEDRRIGFIYQALETLQAQLKTLHSSLEVYYGFPGEVFRNLMSKYKIEKVFANHDYEPYAIQRDEKVHELLRKSSASLHTYKDQVIFEKEEVIKDNGKPYSVFTPYSKRWKRLLTEFYSKSYPTEKYFRNFYQQAEVGIPSYEVIGFRKTRTLFPPFQVNALLLNQYAEIRDFPGTHGTSKVGVHLRFGTASIRKLLNSALPVSESFVNELVWREFYQMILWHFPRVAEGRSFKPEYDFIKWRNNDIEFEKWCNGMTGYPIVDAGMRELNLTGFMHNRVRMIVASFLVKHLLIDWRWGEAYFAKKLLDFDFAANNGGWQWAAGSGCDAAPYFRVFNPALQTKKFDPELIYVRRWVPEFENLSYPLPMVEHGFARQRALKAYAEAIRKLPDDLKRC